MSQELRSEPWLAYIDKYNKDGDDTKTFYSLCNGGGHVDVRKVPIMRNKVFCSCSRDWLVLMNPQERDWTLVNPRTMESFQLPSLPSVSGAMACVVSSSPSNLSSVIVVLMVSDISSKKVGFMLCKLGDESWTKQQEVEGGRCICRDLHPELQYLPKFTAIGSFNGDIYVLACCCNGLFKVQIDDEHCSIRLVDLNLKKPEKYVIDRIKRSFQPNLSLVQYSSTELMIVEAYVNHYSEDKGIFDNDCRAIELYTVNLQEKVWTRVETLPGDCAVFIGSHPSNNILLSNAANSRRGVRGNTVYFVLQNDRYFYAYDVQGRSITVSLPWPDVKHDFLDAVWVQPLCSLSSTTVDDDDDGDGDGDPRKYASDTTIVLSEDRWSNIPIHLLSYIQSLLFGADRCCFRLVCRTWQLAFSAEITTSVKMGGHGFPLLLHIGNGSDQVGIFDPITNSRSTLPAPDLRGGVIRCSKHGWLLVTKGSYGRSIFFYNAFTKERIDLPNLQRPYEFEEITFTSPPTLSDCIVFGYSISSQVVTLKYLYRRHHTWLTSQIGIDKIGGYKSYTNLVYHQGKFYVTPKIRNADLTSKPCSSMRRTNVVECDGRLLRVATGHLGRFVKVYDFNQDTKVWEELDSLGDEMLFVSSSGTTLSATSNGVEISGLGNKVFLDRFNGEDGVFYSLATRKFHTFWSGYNSHDWCDTKEYTHRAWIQPNFEMHTKEELQWV